jgi:hypothetical protein
MELRPALMPPEFGEEFLERLCELARQLEDCCLDFQDCEGMRAEFNRLAQTSLELRQFSFSGATDAETFVRGVLNSKCDMRVPDVTRSELLEMLRRVSENEGEEHEVDFWLELLRINIPDDQISDLIFWPDEYFASDPDAPAELDLTTEQMLDIALKKGPKRAQAGNLSS